jgi:hypothetical protein
MLTSRHALLGLLVSLAAVVATGIGRSPRWRKNPWRPLRLHALLKQRPVAPMPRSFMTAKEK